MDALSPNRVSASRFLDGVRRRAVAVSVAIVWKGRSRSARPARKTSLFGASTFGGVDRDQKSPVRRCFKSRSPAQAGFAGSPPAAGFCSTFDRPLVRIRADRHTTTGTCDLGRPINKLDFPNDKKNLRLSGLVRPKIKGRRRMEPLRPLFRRLPPSFGPDTWLSALRAILPPPPSPAPKPLPS